ncbi:MAG TPA: ABC transporter permease [Saliniramus sp.]|nr:ABC transporter permease [Saliniramus sp.]HMB11082.1 ABC transporter permease [Saliniramus sp.]
MTSPDVAASSPRLWRRIYGNTRSFFDGDIFYSFRQSPLTIVAFLVTMAMFTAALFAPWVAPYDTYDLGSLNLMDAYKPPAWSPGGDLNYLLGTDDQGRDVLSAMIFGLRISLLVGFSGVVLAAAFGMVLGLVSGYFGGWIDAVIMRIADVQLTFPAILIALMIDGVASSVMSTQARADFKIYVIILAIAASLWVNFARTVRGSTLVEKNREYVQAAKVMGIHPILIMLRHVLPNVMGPVLVIATLSLAVAILTEATLSFLGVGVPPTNPSLGTLIRIGNNFLFSGEWWMSIFPGVVLVVLVLAVNLLGDWLRDALNPKLR